MLSAFCEKLGARGWFVILLLLNVVTFRRHFSGEISFPFDFGMTYYGFTAFWISAVQSGVSPEWVPFQAYGYPLLMNPQAYFFYGPHWIIALTGIRYTGYVHTVLQCGHILLGAAGFYLLALCLLKDRQWALVGAIIFNFFGGFFSNSEHPDIVRGFAFCPWLIWALHLEESQRRLEPRNWLLPLIVYLIGTGVYPGQVVASCLLSGCYVITVFLQSALLHRERMLRRARLSISLGFLFLLGMVLALPQLYAGILFGDLTTRGLSAAKVVKWGWDLRLVPLLVFSWDRQGLPYDSVMTSLFIGLPAFFGLFFVPKIHNKSLLLWLPPFIAALVLIVGEPSLFYRFLGRVFPQLLYSRFPGTDYRAFVAAGLIVIALLGMRHVFEISSLSELRNRYIAVIFGMVCLFGGFTGMQISEREVEGFILMTILLALLIAMRICFRIPKIAFLISLIILILFNSYQLLWSVRQYWTARSIDEEYSRQFGITTAGPLPIVDRFKKPYVSRPARTQEPKTLAWVGYLNGTFHADDYTGLIMKTRADIDAHPVLRSFMSESWRAVEIPNRSDCEGQGRIEQVLGGSQKSISSGRVSQMYYGMDKVIYTVAEGPQFSFLENESYFPGWRAVLTDRSGVRRVVEASECFGMRRWNIPDGGPYKVEAYFQFPHRRVVFGVFVVGIFAYLALLLWALFKRCRLKRVATSIAKSN